MPPNDKTQRSGGSTLPPVGSKGGKVSAAGANTGGPVKVNTPPSGYTGRAAGKFKGIPDGG